MHQNAVWMQLNRLAEELMCIADCRSFLVDLGSYSTHDPDSAHGLVASSVLHALKNHRKSPDNAHISESWRTTEASRPLMLSWFVARGKEYRLFEISNK